MNLFEMKQLIARSFMPLKHTFSPVRHIVILDYSRFDLTD